MSYTNRFNSLCAFIRGEADGSLAENDVTYRAYDLDRKRTKKTFREAVWILNRLTYRELEHDLNVIGLHTTEDQVARWWVWDRLCRGELRRWPHKAKKQLPSDTTDQAPSHSVETPESVLDRRTADAQLPKSLKPN